MPKPAVFAALLTALVLGCVPETAPPTAHEDDAPPEVTLQGHQLADLLQQDGDRLVTETLELAEGANRVALMARLADGSEPPALVVRGVDDGVAGPWRDVEWTFDELGHLAGFGGLDEVWVQVQVGVHEDDTDALRNLTFSPAFVDDAAIALAAAAEDEQPLSPALAFVGVKPRSAWGARPTRCTTRDGGYHRMALHHTAAPATGNVELALRQAQAYHMDGRGYCDIAYHFGVSQDGRVFELRPQPFRGGHTLNNNTGNVGIVHLGCFHPTCGNDQPTDALVNASAGIVRMLHELEGIPINSDRVRGHRDHSYAQTACPGNNLYARLGDIRAIASQSGEPPPPPPPAPTGCGILSPGQALAPGQSLSSCNGRASLVHQGDGNVVLYFDGGAAAWHTSTNGQATGTFVMQGDGNLVLYTPWGTPLWSSGTNGRPEAYLRVQDDGNLVVYQGSTALWVTQTSLPPASSPPPPAPAPPPPAPAPAPADCGALPSGASLAPGQSRSSCDGRFTFVHQGDGNVVLYQNGAAIWSTGTHGNATETLAMQGDGNLVLYRPGGQPLWHTSTNGHAGARLAIQDDGNVVLYAGATALWSTGTHGR